ncbi:hypothetical protein [Tepidibacter mesophilus]|uniref:hypothetical protein n=1 Tax=Tepidibacter mesophilus TaxID=655607 RepID=UPI000C087D35|nr:hypothetical protein [Tepidibacter mesophilus]
MLKKIILGLCFFCIFVLDGFLERACIIIFTIGIYNIVSDKNTEFLITSFFISYFILNFLIIIFFQENIKTKILELSDKEQSKKAIVLVYDGEDRRYNLNQRAKEIYYRNGIYSFFNMTYNLYKYKGTYEHLGSSQFKDKSNLLRKKLSEKLKNEYTVVNSNLYTDNYIEDTLIDLLNRGYKNIIVCPMFLTEGKDYDLLKNRIDNLGILKYEVNMSMTDLLWNSRALANAYKEEIINTISDNKSIGVLLVGLEKKNNLNEDILFRQKIKKYLEYDKNYDIKVKLPLLENHKKDIIKAGDELLEYGVDRLYLVMPTALFENIYIRSLGEYILEKLDIPDGTGFYYIGPFNENDVLVDELYKKIKLIENEGGK